MLSSSLSSNDGIHLYSQSLKSQIKLPSLSPNVYSIVGPVDNCCWTLLWSGAIAVIAFSEKSNPCLLSKQSTAVSFNTRVTFAIKSAFRSATL